MAKNCIEDSEYRGHPQGQPSHRVNSTGRDPGIQGENANNQTPTLRYQSVARGISWYRRDQVRTPATGVPLNYPLCYWTNMTPSSLQPPLASSRLHWESATALSSGAVQWAGRAQDGPQGADARAPSHGQGDAGQQRENPQGQGQRREVPWSKPGRSERMPPSRTAPRDGNGKKTVGTRAPSRHQGRADGSYRGLKGRKRDCHTGGTVIAEPLGVRR